MTIVKRYVNELNKEELKEVFNTNEKLRQDIMEDAAESELFWVGEKLDYVRDYMRDWSISAFDRSYIRISNERGFLEGLQQMQLETPAFGEDKGKRIFEAVELCRQLDETQDQLDELDCQEDEEEYNEVEAKVEAKVEALTEQFESEVERLGDMLATELQRDLEACYDEDNALDYFLNFYAEERMEVGMWVNENYELFKDVSYVKSYK